MNEFKLNLIFKKEETKDETSFQTMMNELFLQYLKNQINTCQKGKTELSYIQ